MHQFFKSLSNAIAGTRHVVRSEANMRWHLLITTVVIAFAIGLRINMTEWALVIGCIGAVMALECFNTSIERLADRVSTEQDLLIGQSKDAAAAAVLIMSLAAAVIGLMIFLPKLWMLVGQ